MNINQRNKPAVGRGLILRQLATMPPSSSSEESRSNNSTSSESLLETSKDSSSTDYSESGYRVTDSDKDTTITTSGLPKTRGRGQILQKMSLAKSSLCNDTFIPQSVAKPYVSGRGRLLKSLAEYNQQKEILNDRFVDDDESASIGFESMSLESAEEEPAPVPVIKRGTRGTYFLIYFYNDKMSWLLQ